MAKKLRAGISVLLALTLSLCMLPAAAFAAPAKLAEETGQNALEWKLPAPSTGQKVGLVTFGDSTSNGYFLDTFQDGMQGIGDYSAVNCYPRLIYQDLVDVYGEDNVNFNQFCIDGMRWNEFRYMLDQALNEGKDPGLIDDFAKDHNDSFVYNYLDAKNAGAKYIGTEGSLYAAVKQAVISADVITIDLGMNNFGTYACQRLMKDLGMMQAIPGAYEETLEDIKGELNNTFNDANVSKNLREIEKSLLTSFNPGLEPLGDALIALDALTPGTTEYETALATVNGIIGQAAAADSTATIMFDVVEMVIFGYGCVLLNFDKSLDLIYKNNPDVMVIVDGLYNGMSGLNAIMPGRETPLDLGDVWGMLVANVNGFLSGTSTVMAVNRFANQPTKYNYRFTSAGDDGVEIFIDEVKNFTGDPLSDYHKEGFNIGALNRMVDLVYRLKDNAGGSDDLPAMIGPALLSGINEATKANVKAALSTSIPAEFAGMVDVDAIAEYVGGKVVAGIQTNFNLGSDHPYLTADDAKKAYANNTISSFEFGIDDFTVEEILKIAMGDYSPLDKLCTSAETSNFAVAAGFEVIRKNIVKAAQHTDFDLASLFGALASGGDIGTLASEALIDFDSASDASKALLHICVRFVGLRGFGTHPDAAGAYAKYEAVSSAMPEIESADVERLAGDTAMETAVAISKKTFETAEYAVVARADGFSDALAASAFAGAMECPILLAYKDNAYNGCVADELKRLGVKTIYIAGGTGAVSEATAGYLVEACGAKIERVDGSGLEGYRGYAVDTALDFAQRTIKLTESQDVILVTQCSFMDALSMSPFAYAKACPVIMLNWDLTLDDRAKAIAEAAAGKVYVAGGSVAVPEASAEDVFGGDRVVRLAGDNGYETSLKIAKYMVENKLAEPSFVCVASGIPEGKGADALAAAALAGRAGGVILLAGYNWNEFGYYAAVEGFLGEYASQVGEAYVLGGTSALNAEYFDLVESLLKK